MQLFSQNSTNVVVSVMLVGMNPQWKWENPPDDLPGRLRAARAYVDLTLEELAQRAGRHRATLSTWENGDPPAKKWALEAALELYVEHTGVSAWWFEKEDLGLQDDEMLRRLAREYPN